MKEFKMPNCNDIERKVPTSIIKDGITLCKRNITDYLKDARIIIKQGRAYHAVISVEFALEEFGKILLIKESAQNPVNGVVDINGTKRGKVFEFCDHNRKVNRALAVIDPEGKYRTIFRIWKGGIWKKGVWDEPEIDHITRLQCAFVDFRNEWELRTKIDSKLLGQFMNQLEMETNTV
jgi:AbiV family abortive infection protein